MAKKIGEIILEKTDWKVDLTLMDIEVVALLSDDALHVSTLENIGPVHTALHYLKIFVLYYYFMFMYGSGNLMCMYTCMCVWYEMTTR